MFKALGKHVPSIIAGHGIVALILVVCGLLTITFRGNIGALVAAATSSIGGSTAILYFTPYEDDPLAVGDLEQIDVNINAKVPINAIGTTIVFPPDTVEIIGISKKKSFLDLWTEETAIKEDSGEIHFSAGTLQKGGLIGTGTALTITVRAKKDGKVTLAFKDIDTQVRAHDGEGTSVRFDARPYSFVITTPPPTPVLASSGGGGGGSSAHTEAEPEHPLPPSTDLDGNGYTNLVDVSILAVKMLMPYNPRYDLNQDGTIGLADFSVLFSRM